jgi:SAM-dependent methyltransferase
MALLESGALEAYDALAAHYDLLTAHYDHARWWRALDRQLRRFGWSGGRVLDVGCGTGRSLAPLLGAGLDAVGCDLSAAMLARARDRLGAQVPLHQADMRRLPDLGEFDLVLCLDDGINYLLSETDLHASIRALARAVGPSGLLAFDTNTLRTYREAFAQTRLIEGDDTVLCWRGHGLTDVDDAHFANVIVEIFELVDPPLWRHSRSVHQQRHWRVDQVVDAIEAADLRLVKVLGQNTGARLSDRADEDACTKTVFVAAPAR